MQFPFACASVCFDLGFLHYYFGYHFFLLPSPPSSGLPQNCFPCLLVVEKFPTELCLLNTPFSVVFGFFPLVFLFCFSLVFLILFWIYSFYFVCVCFPTCMSVLLACLVVTLVLMELELQLIVNHLVGSGN